MPLTPVVRDQLESLLFADLFTEALETRIPSPAVAEPELSLAHTWMVAAEIKVEKRVAKVAGFRGSFTTPGATRVDALEVYCRNCRRPYEDVADADCEGQIRDGRPARSPVRR